MYKGFILNSKCTKDRSCKYLKSSKGNAEKHMSWDPIDIEELHKLAKKHSFCPYYAVKERVQSADLLFMPYNYLVDKKYRDGLKLSFTNSIIILDEAHNIGPCCEDVTSFNIKDQDLLKVLGELQKL